MSYLINALWRGGGKKKMSEVIMSELKMLEVKISEEKNVRGKNDSGKNIRGKNIRGKIEVIMSEVKMSEVNMYFCFDYLLLYFVFLLLFACLSERSTKVRGHPWETDSTFFFLSFLKPEKSAILLLCYQINLQSYVVLEYSHYLIDVYVKYQQRRVIWLGYASNVYFSSILRSL